MLLERSKNYQRRISLPSGKRHKTLHIGSLNRRFYIECYCVTVTIAGLVFIVAANPMDLSVKPRLKRQPDRSALLQAYVS